ncbi:Molecular chaperone (DnaJ super) [Hypoxylon texense]
MPFQFIRAPQTMALCPIHPQDGPFANSRISLLEMQSHRYGTNGKAKCHVCELILEAAEFHRPGSIPRQIAMDPKTAADRILVDYHLNVQKVGLSGSERYTRLPPFYLMQPSLIYTRPSLASAFTREIMWGDMCQRWDIVEDSTTQEAFDRAGRWLSHCMKYDEPCKPPDAHFRPQRLLHVGHGQADEPFLVKPTEPTAYACLSYCWGEAVENVLRTTKSNVEGHYKEIPSRSMPKSVRDAVRVCRGLGISYLWVDSLCIIQDDADDWHHDASMMDRIYLNSQLTIAALEPNSCKAGFLGKQRFGLPGWQRRVRLQDASQEVILRPEPDAVEYSLDKRGWCLQETVLSQRRLCFDGNEMSWECLCRKVCECGHYVWSVKVPGRDDLSLGQLGALLKENVLLSAPVPKTYVSSTLSTSRHLQWLMGTRSPEFYGKAPKRIQELWRTLVSSYSKRLLSRQSDKLMALAGLAGIIIKSAEKNCGENEYLAGLWKIELPFDLAWKVTDFKHSPNPSVDGGAAAANQKHFPSWSWASCDGVVEYDCTLPLTHWKSNSKRKLRVVDECSLRGVQGISPDGTPTSKGGRIRLKGALTPVELAIFEEYTPEADQREVLAATPLFSSDMSPDRLVKTSAFVRSRNLHSNRVYLDKPVRSTMRRDHVQASCWLRGQCKTNCCTWNQGQGGTKADYYCFRLFSWISYTGKIIDGKERVMGPQIWFLVLKLSSRVKGAFERIGVGVWDQSSSYEDEDISHLFQMARTEVVDIV